MNKSQTIYAVGAASVTAILGLLGFVLQLIDSSMPLWAKIAPWVVIIVLSWIAMWCFIVGGRKERKEEIEKEKKETTKEIERSQDVMFERLRTEFQEQMLTLKKEENEQREKMVNHMKIRCPRCGAKVWQHQIIAVVEGFTCCEECPSPYKLQK